MSEENLNLHLGESVSDHVSAGLRALTGGRVAGFAAVIVALCGSVPAGQAQAQENHLDVRTVVQKETTVENEQGETETALVAADRVLPGDKVVYTITFTNVGAEAADNVVITNPIDASLTYLNGSAFGVGMRIEFSVDDGRSFAEQGELRVATEAGERVAEAADYTHLRWTSIEALPAGETGVARFAATVD